MNGPSGHLRQLHRFTRKHPHFPALLSLIHKNGSVASVRHFWRCHNSSLANPCHSGIVIQFLHINIVIKCPANSISAEIGLGLPLNAFSMKIFSVTRSQGSLGQIQNSLVVGIARRSLKRSVLMRASKSWYDQCLLSDHLIWLSAASNSDLIRQCAL